MEVGAVQLDGLVAPLEPRGEEPGERQHHPPQGAGRAEEVEEEEDDGAIRVLQPFLDQDALPALALHVAGDVVAAGDEAHDVGDAVDVVAHGEEDDGPLGVPEALGVYEEGEHREESGQKAHAGPDGHPHVRETLVLRGERIVLAAQQRTALRAVDVHVLARILVHETLPQVVHVTGPVAGWDLGVQGSPASQRRPRFVRAVGVHVHLHLLAGPVHAHVVLVVVGRELGAVEGRGPGVAELVQHGLATAPDALAHGSTRPDRLHDLLRAHGHVDGAEEELELV